MRITFVRPNMIPGRAGDAMEPLVFAYLAGMSRERAACELYDERVETVPLDRETDLVAMTVETYTARRAYQLAMSFRQRGIPVVVGGYHPTFAVDEAIEHADAVVVGDAESVWPTLLDDVERGQLQRVYRGNTRHDLARLPVDRSIFIGKRYARLALVQYGRGCRYACDFCSIRAFYGDGLRQRPLAEVVDEIRRLERRHLFFVDDNLYATREQLAALCHALLPLGVRWSAQVSLDVARDDELLQLMRQSGCMAVIIGFESLSEANLTQMKKHWSAKLGDVLTLTKRLGDHGIMIYGTFVFGYDEDTVDSFDRSLDFAMKAKLFLANFNPLTPMPGTPLYERLDREQRLRYRAWWIDPSYRYGDAIFNPRGMSADELTAGCRRLRMQFNEYGSIAWRMLTRSALDPGTGNWWVYLLANFVSRREIYHKQGAPLGALVPPEVQAI